MHHVEYVKTLYALVFIVVIAIIVFVALAIVVISTLLAALRHFIRIASVDSAKK